MDMDGYEWMKRPLSEENECMCHRDSLREKTSPEKKTDIVSSLVLEDRESMMEEIDKSVDFSSSMKAVLADLNALLDQDKDAFHRHDQEELREQPSVGPSLLDMRSIDDYDWCMSMGTDGKVRIKSDYDRILQHSSLPSICSRHSIVPGNDITGARHPSSSLPAPKKTISTLKRQKTITIEDKLECLGSGDKQIGFPERKIFMEYKLSPDFVWILIDVFEHQSEISLLSKRTVATFCKQGCTILHKEILDRTEWWDEDALASRLLCWRVLQVRVCSTCNIFHAPFHPV
jgi:hypothetical protein